MHGDPDKLATARDWAIDFGRQQLPPVADPMAVSRQLADATLRLLGHASETVAPPGEMESAPNVADRGPEMLGGPELGDPLSPDASEPFADSALADSISALDAEDVRLDPLAAPPWDSAPDADLGSVFSPFQSPEDAFALTQDEPIVSPVLLPTALGSSLGSYTLAPSAVDSGNAEVPSAGSIQSPTLLSGDGQGFEVADESSIASPMVDSQSEIGHTTELVSRDSESAGRAETPSSQPVASGGQSGQTVSLSVTLTHREQVASAAAARVAALAKAAARATAKSVIDQRLSSQRTEDDACHTARTAIFGS